MGISATRPKSFNVLIVFVGHIVANLHPATRHTASNSWSFREFEIWATASRYVAL